MFNMTMPEEFWTQNNDTRAQLLQIDNLLRFELVNDDKVAYGGINLDGNNVSFPL